MNPQAESMPQGSTFVPPEAAPNYDNIVTDCQPELKLRPEDIPNLDHIVTEDDTPVDNIFVEKQQRLLVEPLYTSWPGPGEARPFLAVANVGLFFAQFEPPFVPDVMLSLGVRPGADLSLKQNRPYFMWIVGKPPDVALEIISDRYGEELGRKMQTYAEIGIKYYIIFDPEEHLRQGALKCYGNHLGAFQPMALNYLEKVGLGMTLWHGAFEDHEACWLRWCDQNGIVIPTGKERADKEQQRADLEQQRADQERQRADQERQRADQLEAQLRALGVTPSGTG